MTYFECPNCKAKFTDWHTDWFAGSRDTNRINFECEECEAQFEMSIDWDPIFYVIEDSVKLKEAKNDKD